MIKAIIAMAAIAIIIPMAFSQTASINISSVIGSLGSYIPGIAGHAGINASKGLQVANSLESECGTLYNCNVNLSISSIAGAINEGNGKNITASIIYNSIASGSPYAAQLLGRNLTAQVDMAINYTPKGYEEINSTIKNESGGRYNLTVYWSALGLPSIGAFNVSRTENMVNGAGGSISGVQQADYIYDRLVFRNGTVMLRNVSELHIAGTVRNSTYTERLVRSNITVLAANGRYAVEMSDLVGKSPTYVNISYGSEFRNVTIVPGRNYGYAAMAIITVRAPNSSCASQRCWNASINSGIAPSVAPGRVYSYIYVNSTMNDSSISGVTYSFNVSKAWIAAHGYNQRYISLYRATASNPLWNRLPTTLVGSNSTDYFYSATSPGMSVYAISYSAPIQQQTAAVPTQKGSYLDAMILTVVILLIVAAYYALLRGAKKVSA